MLDTALLVIGLVAGSVTLVLIPPVRAAMIRWGVLDRPNHRSSHSAVTPRGGGIACLVGMLLGSAFGQVLGVDVPWNAIAGSSVLALIGFIDDRVGLAPFPRLLAQLLIGGGLGWALGGTLWAILGALVTALVVNVINFMDGINGITGATLMVWGVAALSLGWDIDNYSVAVLGVVAASVAAGFLPWNVLQGRVFLGDVGSYLFGGLVASAILLAATAGSGGARSAIIIIAPLAIYLIDVFTTLIRRVVRAENITEAHREHTYQRLATSPALHAPVALWVAGLSGVIAFSVQHSNARIATLIIIATGSVYLLAPTLVGLLRTRRTGV